MYRRCAKGVAADLPVVYISILKERTSRVRKPFEKRQPKQQGEDLSVEMYMRKTGVNNKKASIFAYDKTAMYADVEV